MPAQFTSNSFSRYAYPEERGRYLGKSWSEIKSRTNPLSRISGMANYGLIRCTFYNPIGCRVMDGVRKIFAKTSRDYNGEIKSVRPRLAGLVGVPMVAGGAAVAGGIYRDQIAQGVTDAANFVAENFNEHVVPVWEQVSEAVAEKTPEVIDAIKDGAEVVADGFTAHFGESTATLAGGAVGVSLAPFMAAKIAHKYMGARNNMNRLHSVVNDLTAADQVTRTDGQKVFRVSLSTLRRLEKIRNLDRSEGYTLKILRAGEAPDPNTMEANQITISNSSVVQSKWRGITVSIKDDRGNVLRLNSGEELHERFAKKIKKMAYYKYGNEPYFYANTEKLTKMIEGRMGLSDRGRGFISKALLGPRVGAYKNMNFFARTLHHLKDIVLAPINLTALTLTLHSTFKVIRQTWVDDRDVYIDEKTLQSHLKFVHNKKLDPKNMDQAISAFDGAAVGGAIAAAAGAVSLGYASIPVFLGAAGVGLAGGWGLNRMANRGAQDMRDKIENSRLIPQERLIDTEEAESSVQRGSGANSGQERAAAETTADEEGSEEVAAGIAGAGQGDEADDQVVRRSATVR